MKNTLGFHQEIKGFTQISNIVIRHSEIPIKNKMLHIAIASRNPSYPSYSQLMKDLGTKSRSLIAKGIKWLCEKNIISYDKGYKKGVSNRYRISPMSQWSPELVPTQYQKVPHLAKEEQIKTSDSINFEPELVSEMNCNNNKIKRSLSAYMTPEEIDYFAAKNKTLHLFPRFRFHDLRHCFASHFMMNNGNLRSSKNPWSY